MNITEITKEQRVSRASLYAQMVESAAWKDLERWADAERIESMKRVDDKDASALNLGTVCEERGIRKGLLKLIQHAHFCREGI